MRGLRLDLFGYHVRSHLSLNSLAGLSFEGEVYTLKGGDAQWAGRASIKSFDYVFRELTTAILPGQ